MIGRRGGNVTPIARSRASHLAGEDPLRAGHAFPALGRSTWRFAASGRLSSFEAFDDAGDVALGVPVTVRLHRTGRAKCLRQPLVPAVDPEQGAVQRPRDGFVAGEEGFGEALDRYLESGLEVQPA